MAYNSDSDVDGPRPMNRGASPCPCKLSRYRSPTLDEAGKVFKRRKNSERSWKWIISNLVGALAFHFGLLQKLAKTYHLPNEILVSYVDSFLSILFLWNSLVNLYTYLLPSLKSETIAVSKLEKQLLRIRDNDKSFSLKKPVERSTVQPTPTTHVNSWVRRRQSTPSGSILQERSPDKVSSLQLVTSSLNDFRKSQSPVAKASDISIERTPTSSSTSIYRANTSSSSLKGFQTSPGRSPANKENQISDADSLQRYLKSQEEKDSKILRAQLDSPHSSSQSLWSYGRGALDFIPSFGSYQLAIRSPQSSSQKDEDISASAFDYELLWKNLKIGREDLEFWTENLRKWLAETIVEKLVAEINCINDTLVQSGCSELQIGTVSVYSLRNIALTKSQLLPSLKSVIPYLDITANQEYLVARLEELATGGCLRLYKWDSGGSFKGKAWDQELPTDGQIIAHLFCTYMDTHLPSNPRYPDGNSFSGLHFLKPPSKPTDRKSHLCILQTRTHPPHFRVVKGDDTHEVPRGRHNLFNAVSIFLYLVKMEHHGMLERVNLGMSGINVLWILNRK